MIVISQRQQQQIALTKPFFGWMWGYAQDARHLGVLLIQVSQCCILSWLSSSTVYLTWRSMHFMASEMIFERKRKYPALRAERGFGSNVLASRSHGEKQHASSVILLHMLVLYVNSDLGLAFYLRMFNNWDSNCKLVVNRSIRPHFFILLIHTIVFAPQPYSWRMTVNVSKFYGRRINSDLILWV